MVTRFDDWQWEIIDLATGAKTPLDAMDVLSVSGETVAGATRHRLKSATLEGPTGTADSPSVLSAALSYTGWQLLHIIPNQDTTHEMWGLILKGEERVSPNAASDRVRLVVAGIERLMHSRIVDNAGAPLTSGGATGDDFAKKLVKWCAQSGTVQNDPAGNSRVWDWGTLSVEADESAADATPTDLEEQGGYLDEVIDALAEKYGFAYELKPTLSGGAFTFTFNTAAPRGGSDKTSGANRVVLNDFGDGVPSGSRFMDRTTFANALYLKECEDVEISAGSIAALGRWEARSQGTTDEQLQVMLERNAARTGDEWEIDEANNLAVWMTDWDAGDLVLRNNARLGISESSEEVAAIIWKFGADGLLSYRVRWGDRQMGLTDMTAPKAFSIGTSTPEQWADDGDISAVAPSNAAGNSRVHVGATHAHYFGLNVGPLGAIVPTGGEITMQIGTGLTATKVDDNTFTVAVNLAESSYWDRDTSGAPYLYPATNGDGVHLYSEAFRIYGGTQGSPGSLLFEASAAGALSATGSLTLSGNRAFTVATSTGNVRAKGEAGGWAMSYGFIGSGDTDRGGFGAQGADDSLTKYWIGPAYDNAYVDITSSLLSAASVINAVTGYQVNGAAASGHVLRGDGTKGVFAALQAGDIPDLSGAYVTSVTAGAGLTGGGSGGSVTLDVGAGDGITVNANDVALTTPGTLTYATGNSASGNHTHAVTASSNPGATASLLETDSNGYLQLVRYYVGSANDYVGLSGSNSLSLYGNSRIVLWIGGTAEMIVDTGEVRPNDNNGTVLGGSSYRWSDIYGVDADLSGKLVTPEWEYAGSPTIDATGAGATTVTITNSGAGSAGLTVDAVINAGTGYTVGGAAASGHVLRGDGTKGVFAALQAGDLPAHDIITAHSDTGLSVGQVIMATGATTFAWSAQSGIDHGALGGLNDDDHGAVYPGLAQAETISGNWTITGSWTLSTNVAVDAGVTVDGVNISIHTHDYYKPVNYHASGYDGDVTSSDWTAPAAGGSEGDRGYGTVYSDTDCTPGNEIGYFHFTSHTHKISYDSVETGVPN